MSLVNGATTIAFVLAKHISLEHAQVNCALQVISID
jgi:hypothetical protein